MTLTTGGIRPPLLVEPGAIVVDEDHDRAGG